MTDRRSFLLGAAALGLAGCGDKPPPPTVVNLTMSAAAGANAVGGADRPLTVHVLRLKEIGAFQTAAYADMQDPAAALGGDLVGMDQVVLAPGGSAERTVTFEPEAGYLGIVAAYRSPDGVQWRGVAPVPAQQTSPAKATFGPAGVTLTVG